MALMVLATQPAPAAPGLDTVTVNPAECQGALRNPLKGFRPRKRNGSHEFGTLSRVYLKWNDLERSEADGIDQIMRTFNRACRDVEKHNIKVIPRVYLYWPKKGKYWPEDMEEDDFSSRQFKERLVRLTERLGQCWDNDPRVAWIQMGLIGAWGEHHSPKPDAKMQKLLGDTFTQAFKNKMVTVRHPWEFEDYKFGVYWDSWAHLQQMKKHGGGIAQGPEYRILSFLRELATGSQPARSPIPQSSLARQLPGYRHPGVASGRPLGQRKASLS